MNSSAFDSNTWQFFFLYYDVCLNICPNIFTHQRVTISCHSFSLLFSSLLFSSLLLSPLFLFSFLLSSSILYLLFSSLLFLLSSSLLSPPLSSLLFFTPLSSFFSPLFSSLLIYFSSLLLQSCRCASSDIGRCDSRGTAHQPVRRCGIPSCVCVQLLRHGAG